MIYRDNPALPPRFRSPESGRAHLIADAAIQRIRGEVHEYHQGDPWKRMCAQHILDLRSTSDLLERAVAAAGALAEWWKEFGLPDFAPLGTGRRGARDCGGRIASAVAVWAGAEVQSKVPPGDHRTWALAYPATAGVISGLVAGPDNLRWPIKGWLEVAEAVEWEMFEPLADEDGQPEVTVMTADIVTGGPTD